MPGRADGLLCVDCNEVINTRNSHSTGGYLSMPRCGKCYLKWKREERRRKGRL